MSPRFLFVLFAVLATGTAIDWMGALTQAKSAVQSVDWNEALQNAKTAAQGLMAKCTEVKKLLGVTKSKATEELRVEDLTISFKSGGYSETYKMTTAAKDILADKYYNINQPLYVFVHGWNSDATKSHGITEALYDRGHSNVLAVDSSKYLRTWDYLKCSVYVQLIGAKLAEVLIALNEAGLDRKNIHVMGHSLGAQISSNAGKMFQNQTGTKIGRITGMDPAGPCFSEVNDNFRLCKDDADFVDVIHSNAGVAGLFDPIGHVDFYPNGGTNQPGCMFPTCDHGRSMTYFAESINDTEAFPAVQCGSWEEFGSKDGEIRYMGFGATPDGPEGSYYLRTGSKAPYGLGMKGIRKAEKQEKKNNWMNFLG